MKQLLRRYGFKKELEDLKWVRNSHIYERKTKIKERLRTKILHYVERHFKSGHYVSEREISKYFGVNIGSYFSGMAEVYEGLGIAPGEISNFRMGRNFDREQFKERILRFVKEESRKGNRPTYKEIQGRFRCLPKLFFPGGIRQIYKKAGVKYSRRFATKTPEEKERMRGEVIHYVKTKVKKGSALPHICQKQTFYLDKPLSH